MINLKRLVGWPVLALTALCVHSSPAAWRELYAASGGTVYQIAVDYQGYLYTITSAGLYRSTDQGQHWISIGVGLPTQTLNCIATASPTGATDPITGNLDLSGAIYVGGQQGLYKSTDSGLTWATVLDTNTRIPAGSARPFNTAAIGLIAVAADTSQSIKKTWIFLATNGNFILRSQDGGVTWTQLSNGLQNAPNAADITSIAIDAANPSPASWHVYTSTWRGRLFRSDNGGDSFSQISDSGIWANGQIYIAYMSPQENRVLYTINDELNFGRGTILRSADSGETWFAAGRPANGAANGVSQIAIDPTDQNANTVYAATNVGISKTMDGGATWNVVYSPSQATLPLSAMYAVTLDTTNSSGQLVRVYAGSAYYGFALSLYYGFGLSRGPVTGWVLSNNGLIAATITDIAVCNNSGQSVVYASVQTVGYLKSTDGGTTWYTVPGSITTLAGQALSGLSVDPQNCNILVSSTNSGLDQSSVNTWRSIDGGNTFTTAAATYGSQWIRFNPANPNRVLMALPDYQGAFFLSTDSGATWTLPENTYVYPANFVFHPSFPNIVITRGNQYTGAPQDTAYVLWSNNAGDAPWVLSDPQGAGTFGDVALDTSDSSTLYVSGNLASEGTQGIYKFQIIYNGATVSTIQRIPGVFNTGLTDLSVQRLLYDPVHQYLYASTASGVFRSTDKAMTWTSISAGLPYLATDVMAISPDGSALLVGTSGGIWEYRDTNAQPAVLQVSVGGTPVSNIDFGNTPENGGNTVTVTITNIGQSPATALTVVRPAAPFMSSSTCPGTLAAGAQCTVDVMFQPQSPGPQTSTLLITSVASNSPISISLTGNGINQSKAIMTVSTAALNFPDQLAGTSSGVSLPFMISNSGNIPGTVQLTRQGSVFTAAATPTPACPSSNLSGTISVTVAPNSACSVQVIFTPEQLPGQVNCSSVTIDTSANESIGTITITGDGIASALIVNLTGTSLRDSDGDGIPDLWELQGIKDSSGNTILDLPSMGADPCKKDVFVQVNWMKTTAHSHEFKIDAANMVIAAFSNAPVSNLSPKGTGINLHIDCGPGCTIGQSDWITAAGGARPDIPHFDPVTGDPNALGFQDQNGNYVWSSMDIFKATYLPQSRLQVYHYIVMGHQLGGAKLTTSSGYTRPGGTDSIVSLGDYDGFIGNTQQQAGTFMHELGHSLGLVHGGYYNGVADASNFKPNYFSMMNYFFQTRGLVSVQNGALLEGVIDYSRVDGIPPLDTGNLSETYGVYGNALSEQNLTGLLAGYGTRYFCAGIDVGPTYLKPINWDCSSSDFSPVPGSTLDLCGTPPYPGCRNTGVSADISGTGSTQRTVLAGTDNDWKNLIYTSGGIGQAGAPPPPQVTTSSQELTIQEDSLIKTVHGVTVSGPGDMSLPLGGVTMLKFTVKNNGSVPDVFSLAPSSSQTWFDFSGLPQTLLPLAAGISTVVSVPVRIPASLSSQGDTATVSVKATSSANPILFDTAKSLVTAGSADLGLTVSASPNPALVGNKLTYSLVITNYGPDPAQNATIVDSLPAGLTLSSAISTLGQCIGLVTISCSLGSLQPRDTATVTLIVTPSNAGTFANTTTASSSTYDPNTANNSVTTSSTIVGKPGMTASLSSQSFDGTTLNITFTNSGTGAASNIVVTQINLRTIAGAGSVTEITPPLPFGINNLGPGASAVVTLTLNVPATVTRFAITEVGSMQDALGDTYTFSPSQAVIH